MSLLNLLRRGRATRQSVAVVIAHPDDETLGLGGALSLMPQTTIVQLTDGAPELPTVWARAGETSRANYRAMRRSEREAAWAAAGWILPVTDCEVMDQTTHQHAGSLIARLEGLLADVEIVWTHPYEGGHPDHDTAACVVQIACERLGVRAPQRLEFASYHWNGHTRVSGIFWHDATCPEAAVVLSGEMLAKKQRALAAYASQRSVIRWFPPTIERYRSAPTYDFTHPPPPPDVWYTRRGWAVTDTQWRAAIARAA